MLDLLRIPLLEAHQTGGLFSVTEQWMPKDSGAHTKHVHNGDEWFYVLDGTVDFELEGETSSGQDGALCGFLGAPCTVSTSRAMSAMYSTAILRADLSK